MVLRLRGACSVPEAAVEISANAAVARSAQKLADVVDVVGDGFQRGAG